VATNTGVVLGTKMGIDPVVISSSVADPSAIKKSGT
jgi:hypothetical protein